jgi:hypothetical protein
MACATCRGPARVAGDVLQPGSCRRVSAVLVLDNCKLMGGPGTTGLDSTRIKDGFSIQQRRQTEPEAICQGPSTVGEDVVPVSCALILAAAE